MDSPRSWRAIVAALAAGLLAAGCRTHAEPTPPSRPEAGFVVVAARDVPLDIELSGRTTAFEVSEVRPQVTGILMARRFAEGSIVRPGQTLYEIDPSLYRTAAAQASANLAAAQAGLADAQAKEARYRPLADAGFVSKQDYADVLASEREAAAQVGQQNAAVHAAKVNLGFTRVPAPIGGRIGRSLVSAGALVTSGQATALTTIERLDPIYVDIQQSSADLLALRRELAGGARPPASAEVRLILEDGSAYPAAGRLEFTEPIVDPSTGSVTLRARFPNPDGVLLPGMFVRARLAQAVVHDAVLVPQQAVARDPKGDATVLVVGPGDRAQLRAVTADRTVGQDWLVASGLSAGDRVIVEGLDRIRPGQLVRAVPAGSAPRTPARPAGRRAG
jgi:membrane fusion protein (multidrug efflux system)